eukprot:5564019-Ditylum_brightwellii.AAC.1
MVHYSQTGRAFGQKHLLKVPIPILWTEHHHIRKQYYNLKKKGTKMRAALTKKKTKEQKAKGNRDEAQRLHNMLSSKKQRKQAERF